MSRLEGGEALRGAGFTGEETDWWGSPEDWTFNIQSLASSQIAGALRFDLVVGW
jgi:hypothetical protein